LGATMRHSISVCALVAAITIVGSATRLAVADGDDSDAAVKDNCIKACLDCMRACRECLLGCDCPVCEKHCLTCIDVCQASVALMEYDSTLVQKMCELCQEACDACAEECEKCGDKSCCTNRVEACKVCRDACDLMRYQEGDESLTDIQVIMYGGFGGMPPGSSGGNRNLPSDVISGRATEQEEAEFVEWCEKLSEQAPPRGDVKEWRETTEVLLNAAKDVAAGGAGRAAAANRLEAAVRCTACHDQFRR